MTNGKRLLAGSEPSMFRRRRLALRWLAAGAGGLTLFGCGGGGDALTQPLPPGEANGGVRVALAQRTYRLVDIGPGIPGGLNELGQVAVNAGTVFLWDPNKGLKDLGACNGLATQADDLNDHGQMAGTVFPVGGRQRAFLFTPGSGYRILETLQGSGASEGRSLNNAGAVVGLSDVLPPDVGGGVLQHAFRFTADMGMIDLGTLDGIRSEALAINDGGQVTGWYGRPDGAAFAFVWDETHGMVPLSDQGSQGRAINAEGQIAGSMGSRSFLFTPGQGFETFGDGGSSALGMNDHGHVVGNVLTTDRAGGSGHAYFWSRDTGFIDLNDALDEPHPGLVLRGAAYINNCGWIAATAEVGGTFDTAGDAHAVVLMPTAQLC